MSGNSATESTSAEQGPVLTLRGQLVGLGPLDRSFLSHYHRWANDLEISRTLGLSWPVTMEQVIATYESRARATDAVWFTVVELSTGRPIGLVYLFEIEPRHRRATFGILIGEADARGRGRGTEATRLILRYAFDLYGLSNVMLTVYADNHAGRRAYEKAGFRAFGRRRACSVLGQELVDLIYMEAVAGDLVSSGNDPADA
jgi:RimJ/RimL family protein N-acetyltransferase